MREEASIAVMAESHGWRVVCFDNFPVGVAQKRSWPLSRGGTRQGR